MVHGIINHGAMCYCNSTVQMLYSMREFRQFIIDSGIEAEPFDGLGNIFRALEEPGSEPIDIKDDFISLRSECMETLSPKRLIRTQEDVRDFLSDCIFRKIEFLGMPDFLNVMKKSTSTCNGVTDEESVPIPGPALLPLDFTKPDIQGNLLSTLHEESMDLARCPEGYTKTTFFTGPPPAYFIFSLNRFVYDRNAEDLIKIKNPVEINNILSIPFEGGSIKYRIKGYISHLGNSAKEGHYYYHGKGDDGQWRVYNDTTIEMAPSYNKEGTYLNVSATEKRRAYIFLYELVQSEGAAPTNTLSSGLQNLSLGSSGRAANNKKQMANKKPNVTRGRPANNKKPNVTRGRKLNKKGAIAHLESRRSVTPNTLGRASRKIRVRPVGSEFTEKNIQNILNFTRKQKAEEKKGKK